MAINLTPCAVALFREDGGTSSAGAQEIVMLSPNYSSFRHLREAIKEQFTRIEDFHDTRNHVNIPEHSSWSPKYRIKQIVMDWNPPSNPAWDSSVTSFLGSQHTILTEANWKAAYQKFVEDKNPTARIVVVLAKPPTPERDFIDAGDLETVSRV